MSDDLREQVLQAMSQVDGVPERIVNDECFDGMADAVLAVFAERERELLAALKGRVIDVPMPDDGDMERYLHRILGLFDHV